MKSYPLRGAIFETMVMGEFVKKRTNAALPINLFFWRDSTGHEIDLIIDNAGTLLPLEIKSGKTITKDFFKNLDYWCKLSGETKSVLMYAGAQSQKRSNGTTVMNWREIMNKEI
jgi:predicted AAA+ superfamily ATPase